MNDLTPGQRKAPAGTADAVGVAASWVWLVWGLIVVIVGGLVLTITIALIRELLIALF